MDTVVEEQECNPQFKMSKKTLVVEVMDTFPVVKTYFEGKGWKKLTSEKARETILKDLTIDGLASLHQEDVDELMQKIKKIVEGVY